MSLEKSLKNIKAIGLSNPEEEVPYLTDEPKIPNFITLPSEYARQKYRTIQSFGQGYHSHEKLARIKSVAELLERLCLDNPNNFNLSLSNFKPSSQFVDPGIFCCYSEEQIGNQDDFKREAKSREYLWFQTKDLFSGSKVFLPAQIIFLTDIFNNEFQIRRESISTGAAFGKVGTNRAFNSGLLEVIERDACIHAYLTRRSMSRIVSLLGKARELEEYLVRYNLEPFIFDATSDLGVPTTMSIVIDRTGIGPAVNVGSASAFTYGESIQKSLLEAVQCRRYNRLFSNKRFQDRQPKENEIFSIDHRFAYWHTLNRINDLDFWLQKQNTIPQSSLKTEINDINQIIGELKRRNFDVFVADITLPEIDKAGFEILKVIIPQMHSLYLDERAKSLYSGHYGDIKNNPELKPHPLT